MRHLVLGSVVINEIFFSVCYKICIDIFFVFIDTDLQTNLSDLITTRST